MAPREGGVTDSGAITCCPAAGGIPPPCGGEGGPAQSIGKNDIRIFFLTYVYRQDEWHLQDEVHGGQVGRVA